MLDPKTVCRRVDAELKRNIPYDTVAGKNGVILKFYPWTELASPWSGMHVEVTPERRKGDGYSVHLDFYSERSRMSLSPVEASDRERLIRSIRESVSSAQTSLGQQFEIEPRQKAHFLVEQLQCVPYGTPNLDDQLAEIVCSYILGFDRPIRVIARR